MSFCTVVNCMDGRTQLPVISYLQDYFGADYVDMVTEPGPVALLTDGTNSALVASIVNRVRISLEKHESVGVAVVAHHDCAGNPVDDELQIKQLHTAVSVLDKSFPGIPKLALWVDSEWKVNKL